MKSEFVLAVAAVTTLFSSGCGSSTSASAPAPLNISGQWSGTGSDSQGAETFTWAVTQTGTILSGAVTSLAADPNDGSCASCHKNKLGVLSGTLNSGVLALTMSFPTGGDVPTPICSVTMNVTTANVSGSQIVANYSGGDSCEGPFVDGAFTMVKK
jgi:hypothetical protein